jgi:recombinational DNA repair ATPase RecF
MKAMEEKKTAQLRAMQERLSQHNTHVVEAKNKFSRETGEKIQQKMQLAEKNREEQLRQQLEKLKTHESRIEQVRINKLNRSVSEDKENSDTSINDSKNEVKSPQ